MVRFSRLQYLLLLLSLLPLCWAQSGDGTDDEDQLEIRTTFACENGMLTLECPEDHVIRIVRANFGRFTLAMCNPSGITSNMNLRCQSVTASRIVATECDGHNRCEFQVTTKTFGDPCPGTLKYAEVKHYCEAVHTSGLVANSTASFWLHLPDAPSGLRRPTVPVPVEISACFRPSAAAIQYYITWQMPGPTQTMNNFKLMYRVDGEIREMEVQAVMLNDNQFMYLFIPEEDKLNRDHLFAVKAFSVDFGWGDYSDFISAIECADSWMKHILVHVPTEKSPTTTASPKGGWQQQPKCPPVEKLGVHWPATSANEVSSVPCPKDYGHGVMHFKCLSTGVWDLNGPETDDCVPVEPVITTKSAAASTLSISTTTTAAKPTYAPPSEDKVPVPIDYNLTVTNMLHSLAKPGSKPGLAYDVVSLLPDLLNNVTSHLQSIKDPRERKHIADQVKDSILSLSEELLRDGRAWSNMTVAQQRTTAASLLDSMETTGLLAASTLDVGTSITAYRSNVVMKVMNVDVTLGEAAMLIGRQAAGSMAKINSFTIPNAALLRVPNRLTDSVPVVFVVLSNMSEWLTPESIPHSTRDNIIDARPHQEPTRRMVNSDIMSASVSKNRVKNLAEPVMFLMEHRQVEAVTNPKCSFWDTDIGGWSDEGCWVFESNRTHTVCQCSHLTSFAVLMDITGTTVMIPAKARLSLELITYIGCIISILCLMLSWITFACFKSLECDRNTIHKHLVFCLMVAQSVLVIGIQQTQPQVLCSIIAGVLHFFFLASFAWMCLEGVQLYVMLIEVFEAERSRIYWYYLFGYGVPTVIVTISASVYPGGYGTESHCWLTIERGFIWSFVGPALAVMLVNIVMLGIAISIMVRHSSISHTMRQKTLPQKMSVSGSMYSVEAADSRTYHRPELPNMEIVRGHLFERKPHKIGYHCLAGARFSMGGSSLGGYAGGGSHLYASIDHLELLTCAQSTREQQATWLKGALVLVVLLGLSWVFGVLYLDNMYHALIFSYIFTLLNSLQGLFIFLFHCVFNDKVQKEYRRLVRHSDWLPECVRVRYGGASTSGSREQSSSGNVMSRFLRGKKNTGAAESSSNSAKPFLNREQRHSSSMPSSSDGATSSHLSSDTSNNNHRKSSRSSNFHSNGSNSHCLRLPETGGMIGELSEVVDCSVVDSEFVSEYCQQALQVSAEVKRYSTASEESDAGEDREAEEGLDRLAALSQEFLTQRPPYHHVITDLNDGDNKSDGWADSDNVDGEDDDDEEEPVHFIHARDLAEDEDAILKSSFCGHSREHVDEEDDGLVDGDDIRHRREMLGESWPQMILPQNSERMPVSYIYDGHHQMKQQSLPTFAGWCPVLTNSTALGQEELTPVHTSDPCLKFKPGLTKAYPSREEYGPMDGSPYLNPNHGPNSAYRSQHTGAEEFQSAGYSCDGHKRYFSPFKFTASNC